MHSFDPTIAQKVGVNAAIIYQNIRWWCQRNAANERNIIDGRAWSYNSVRAFTTLFPYLTAKQVRSALSVLEKEGLVLVANHNKDARDRTKWYAPADDFDLPNTADRIAQEGTADCPVGQSPFAHEGQPLPVNKPVTKPVHKQEDGDRDAAAPTSLTDLEGSAPAEPKKPKSPPKIVGGLYDGCRSLDQEFERVWVQHPRKVGKGAARSAWGRARSKASFEEIARPLAVWIKLQAGSEPSFICHFSTWLNEERWLDDQTHALNRRQTTSDRLRRLGASTEAGDDTLAGPRTPPQIELRMDP